VAFVAWFVVTAGGCAAITGLDSITEQDCAPNCGDAQLGKDVTVDVPAIDSPGPDTTQGSMDTGSGDSQSMQDSTSLQDTSTPFDAHEASAAEGGVDAPVDSPIDAPHETTTTDAGCGSLSSTSNCSACGEVCTATHATSPQCNGSTCSYTCSAGFLDCNAGTAPDTDGCECPTSGGAGCCSGACPVQHDYDEDIIGATFYDCVAAGTYNETVAFDACTAYAGSTAACTTGYYCTGPDGGTVGDMVCSDGASAPACTCFGYDGQLQGLMVVGPGKGTNMANCECPETGDPKWK
jgi:hypothetical protein